MVEGETDGWRQVATDGHDRGTPGFESVGDAVQLVSELLNRGAHQVVGAGFDSFSQSESVIGEDVAGQQAVAAQALFGFRKLLLRPAPAPGVGALLTDDEWLADYAAAAHTLVDPDSLAFWQVVTGVKMSILAWRAVEVTPPGREHDLLVDLFGQLQEQLVQRLAAGRTWLRSQPAPGSTSWKSALPSPIRLRSPIRCWWAGRG